MRPLLLVGAMVLVSACYRPGLDECAVRCGEGGACPSGLSCDTSEGFCQSDPSATCSSTPGDDGGVPDGDVPPGTKVYTELSAGDQHACAIRDDKTLWCWGRGDESQLGNAQPGRSARPQQVDPSGPADWLVVEAGALYTCGIRGAALPGDLYCWGDNRNQQASDNFNGVTPEPTLVTGGPWRAVSLGTGTTCAIASDDHLWCWGSNGFGIRGTDASLPRQPATEVRGGIDHFRSISVGLFSACGILLDGSLACWGSQGSDQLLGHTPAIPQEPSQVGAALDWEQVAVSDEFVCGIRRAPAASDRTLWCWGRDSGNLGKTPGGDTVTAPLQIGTAKDWKSVAIDGRHGCGVRAETDGDHLFCWGINTEGQVGVGDRKDHYVATRVGTDAWSVVAAGELFSCALRADGAVHCFGDDAHGQVGDAHAAEEDEPDRVGDQLGWTDVAASRTHTCGIRAGELSCWGYNGYGQLAFTPADGDASAVPVPVATTAAGWTDVAVGDFYTCAIDSAAKLKCWGVNDAGQLGISATLNEAPHPTPTAVVGGAGTWARVAASRSTTCAIGAAGGANAGKLYCWGSNDFSQVGQDGPSRSAPVEVVGGHTDWSDVTLGQASVCALRGVSPTAALFCWGENVYGQHGSGMTQMGATTVAQPVDTTDTSWTALTGGLLHHCALEADGDVFCWGRGSLGQRGDGDTTEVAYSPVALAGDEHWRAIGAGDFHSCAVRDDRQLACWGMNDFGQLGDGMPRDDFVSMPFVVSTETVWDAVSLGGEHSCAVRMDGSLWCWGRNTYGQLGNGQSSSTRPVRLVDPL